MYIEMRYHNTGGTERERTLVFYKTKIYNRKSLDFAHCGFAAMISGRRCQLLIKNTVCQTYFQHLQHFEPVSAAGFSDSPIPL